MIHEELSGKIIGAGMDVLNELRPSLDDPAAAGLRTRKCLGTEKDNLPTKHTKHPKEEKPVLPLLVCFRVFGGQRSLYSNASSIQNPELIKIRIKSMSGML